MKNGLKLSGTLMLGLALLSMLIVALACSPLEEAVPRSYSCAVYTEQGCAKFVVASGGEIEIQSGGTFDLQSGATVDFSGGVDLDGSTLTMDADGDTTLAASQDDVITTTISDTTGYLVVSIGNLKVGDGSPSTSQDGEDAYVEGGFEVDGTARFDGAIDANSTADIAGNLSSATGAITITDNVMVDGAADAVQLTVQGYTTQTNKALVVEQSDGTDVFTVDNNGHAFGRVDYIAKTADYTVTVAETGSLFSNGGASSEVTFTLPSAAEGLNFCFYVYETYTVNVDAASGDQTHHLTNAAGDRIQNTGTAGDSVCVVGADATYWIPLQEIGTWSDAN